MWFLTVSVLRCSSAAICFVEQPCSRRRSTSTWRGVRCGGGAVGPSSGRPSNSPKTPTTRLTAHERHGADLHGHPRAGGRDQDAGRVRGRGGAEHLPGEQLACAPAVLGRDDGGEVATANIADEPLGGRVEPPDDSRLVEHVARDADVLQSLLDVAADFQAGGHHGSVADLRAARHPLSNDWLDRSPASLSRSSERTTGPTLARVICYGRRLRPPRPTRSRGGLPSPSGGEQVA